MSSPQPADGSFAIYRRNRDFRNFQLGRFLFITGSQMQYPVLAFEVWSRTQNEWWLAGIGLALFLPVLLFALLTGIVADCFDRRRVAMICLGVKSLSALLLAFLLWTPTLPLWWFFPLLFIASTASAFMIPASQALMPMLVSKSDFKRAVAWNSTTWQLASIIGPAVGGALHAWLQDAGWVFIVNMMMTVVGLAFYGRVRVRSGRMDKSPMSWDMLLAGVRFIYERKAILGAVSLDLAAVLLGGATALMPIFADKILQVGELGHGVLRAAPGVGALLVALALAHRPHLKNSGQVMLTCVGLFGLTTVLFGLSTVFWFSVVVLVLLGGVDMVSVVIRHTLVTEMTPPAMQGRVSAVNVVFVSASNELGDVEAAAASRLFGPVASVVGGGIGAILITIGCWKWFPELRNYGRAPGQQPEAQLAEKEERMDGT